MYRYKNVAITGERGAGKSTLAAWLLQTLGLPCAGFRTLRYAVTPAGPLYELVDIRTSERAPISELSDGAICGISTTFDGFGVRILERADAPVLLLDEIGRFERNSEAFLRAVHAALDSPKTVIAVLKKEDLPHIQQIKARSDTFLIDLDTCSRERARDLLRAWQEML